jgi:polyhydroxyalkanoate synthase
MVAPLRPLVDFTGGRIITSLYRVMGGAPRRLVKYGYQLAAFDKYVTKPLAIMRNLDDRDFLAQIEAVDRFTANMAAYPGRTFGQLYHRFFRINELAGGKLTLADREIELAEVHVPVLSVAGSADVLAPKAAVHAIAGLLPNAPQVRLETAPGGHLGVLTGRSALRTTWEYLDDFLAEHSSQRGRPPLRVVA